VRERPAITGCLLLLGLVFASAGCKVFDTTAADARSRLSWLTLLAGSQSDALPRLDPEQIRPTEAAPEVAADSLLEVTVWDLFEPEKPHTFPVRVAADETVAVPMLDPVPVAGLTLRELETRVAEAYQKKEILLKPRVLVRSLEPQTLRISVAGAVQNPGFLELPRQDANVYTAILAAGGPRKGAGVHVGISRHESAVIEQTVARPVPEDVLSTPEEMSSEANTLRTVSVEATVAEPAKKSNASVTWYDLAKPADCESLRKATLAGGDSVIVKPAVPPMRIGGDVARPGPYALPVASTVSLWHALDLAGGPARSDEPFQVVLIRPASELKGAQRWVLEANSNDDRPASAPIVQPGDVVHVQHTKASARKTLAGRFFP
jgi:protein involved in polysaccharide export with SLBB domain